MGYVQMHHRGMSSNNRCKLDSEFIVRGVQVIVAKVEHSQTSVSVDCIDNVATALIGNLAV